MEVEQVGVHLPKKRSCPSHATCTSDATILDGMRRLFPHHLSVVLLEEKSLCHDPLAHHPPRAPASSNNRHGADNTLAEDVRIHTLEEVPMKDHEVDMHDHGPHDEVEGYRSDGDRICLEKETDQSVDLGFLPPIVSFLFLRCPWRLVEKAVHPEIRMYALLQLHGYVDPHEVGPSRH